MSSEVREIKQLPAGRHLCLSPLFSSPAIISVYPRWIWLLLYYYRTPAVTYWSPENELITRSNDKMICRQFRFRGLFFPFCAATFQQKERQRQGKLRRDNLASLTSSRQEISKCGEYQSKILIFWRRLLLTTRLPHDKHARQTRFGRRSTWPLGLICTCRHYRTCINWWTSIRCYAPETW